MLTLFHGAPQTSNVILPVAVAHHVDSGGHMQCVVRVEVASESSSVESLQPEDHSQASFTPRKPVANASLEKHVSSAVQILGVRNLDYRDKACLGVPHAGADEGGFVWGKIPNSSREFFRQGISHQVVSSVFDVFAEVHDSRVCFEL